MSEMSDRPHSLESENRRRDDAYESITPDPGHRPWPPVAREQDAIGNWMGGIGIEQVYSKE